MPTDADPAAATAAAPQDAGAPLAELLAQLLAARREGALPAGADAAFTAGAQRVLELKAAHRGLCEATDAAREAAGEAKAALDAASLQLQNLVYERGHYEAEIGACRAWASAYSDEQVGLVPEAEFLAHPLAAERGLADPEADAHQRMLNRLAHEVAYRQQAVRELDGVKGQRDALAADVAQKRSTVAGLEGEVSKLLAAARAVQQQYAIKAAGADSRGAGEERAVDQQRHGGGSAAAAAEGAAADVAMREAGEV